jgi:hypothetical protein
VMLYGLVGAAGLTAGVWGIWSRRWDRSAQAVPRLAGLLAGLSALLVVLAPPPPTSEAPLPCLQIHHCVVTPQRSDAAAAAVAFAPRP